MTRLAFAGKCGCRAASGFLIAGIRLAAVASPARAAAIGQHARQAEHAEAHAGAAEEFAAGERATDGVGRFNRHTSPHSSAAAIGRIAPRAESFGWRSVALCGSEELRGRWQFFGRRRCGCKTSR